MDDSEHDSSVISEDMWRAWAERGRRRHESAARQRRIRSPSGDYHRRSLLSRGPLICFCKTAPSARIFVIDLAPNDLSDIKLLASV